MRRLEKLTPRQEQVLAFVQDRQRQTGFAPTLHETAKHFGFKSPNSVRQHLRLIENKGFLRRVPGRSRALVVVRLSDRAEPDTVLVPLLGRIPAGHPTTANEEREALLSLPSQLYRGNQLFALRVHGNSMNDAAIVEGDIAILDAAREAHDGAICAVVVEGEATLKRVFRQRNGLLLKAENPTFPDIKITGSEAEETRLVGILVGLVRKI